MSVKLIKPEVKIVNAPESIKVNSFAEKIDIFDGRLGQLNKFLEFIVQPKKPSYKRPISKL